MTGTCLCGAASLSVAARPDFIHDCNCSLCRKTDAALGYYPSAQVKADGETVTVMRNDKTSPAAEVHSCASCSATTHFEIAKSFKDQHGPIDVVGVNMKLFDPDDLVGIEVRFPDGRNWSGDGEFGYRREAVVLGANFTGKHGGIKQRMSNGSTTIRPTSRPLYYMARLQVDDNH